MQLDFVQQGGGLYSSVEATVCVRYLRDYRSRVFLVRWLHRAVVFAEVECMRVNLSARDVQAVRLECYLITSNSSIALNVDGGSLTISNLSQILILQNLRDQETHVDCDVPWDFGLVFSRII